MRVLMVGAAGSDVGAVLPELLARGVTVRALVHDEDRGDLARRRGAQEVAVGDTCTVLVSGRQTEGRYRLIDVLIPPAAVPAPTATTPRRCSPCWRGRSTSPSAVA